MTNIRRLLIECIGDVHEKLAERLWHFSQENVSVTVERGKHESSCFWMIVKSNNYELNETLFVIGVLLGVVCNFNNKKTMVKFYGNLEEIDMIYAILLVANLC